MDDDDAAERGQARHGDDEDAAGQGRGRRGKTTRPPRGRRRLRRPPPPPQEGLLNVVMMRCHAGLSLVQYATSTILQQQPQIDYSKVILHGDKRQTCPEFRDITHTIGQGFSIKYSSVMLNNKWKAIQQACMLAADVQSRMEFRCMELYQTSAIGKGST